MEYRLIPRYFEELDIGDRIITPSRTVTEADVVNYASLSGDWNLMHTDEEFARKTIFGKRINYGMLTMVIAAGLVFRLGIIDYNALALLGLDIKWTLPVFIGDTIHCTAEVTEKRPTRKPDRGILSLKILVFNQSQEQVAEAVQTFMYARKPQ